MLQICAPDSIIKINAGDGRSSVFPSPAFLHRRVLTDAGLIHTWKHNMVGWLLAFYMYPFSNICTISEWGLPPHVDAWHQHVLESCLWFMFIFCSYARHFSFMVPGTKAVHHLRMGTDPARWCQTPTCLRIMSLIHVHILFIYQTLFVHGTWYQGVASVTASW